MEGYLGETIVEQKDTPYKDFSEKEWVLEFISKYGGISGDEHKSWLIDQIVRILHGNKIIISIARWENGYEEYRIALEENPPVKYNKWVESIKSDEEGTETYEYNVGLPP